MIHLLWCTIRTQQFVKKHKIWVEKSKNKSFTSHVLVSTEQESDFLDKYFEVMKLDKRIVTFKPPYVGVCLPSYKLSSTLEYEQNDIIIFASDDFEPPYDWDEYLKNKLKDKDGVLMVRDGYQLPDSSNMLHPAITIPIMTGTALNKMNNIIYHPAYHHMFSDCELYEVARDLNILIDDRINDETIFEHQHHASGKRNADIFDREYYSKWKNDEITWNERRNLKIEEKIKL
jgi:hypothetical protein